MRVLFICSKPPYPKVDGGCVATADMLQSYLQNSWNVDLLTMATAKHPFRSKAFPEDVKNACKPTSISIDTKVKPLDALMYLFKDGSYNVARFEDDRFARLIKRYLDKSQYDLVHFEGLYTMPYIKTVKSITNTPCLYRAHNIEYRIWQQKARKEKNPVKSQYYKKLSTDLRTFERNIVEQADGIIAITHHDAKLLGGFTDKPVHTYPISIDTDIYKSEKWPGDITFAHIGAMDWEPNISGMQWFLEEVWKPFVAAHPGAAFHIAGKGLTTTFGKGVKNLHNHGEVRNAHTFMNSHAVLVVPLFSGSGLRIKIIEALALGRLVIATSKAVKGIDIEPKKHFLLANSPVQFIKQMELALNEPDKAHVIAKQGMKKIKDDYSATVNNKKLLKFISKQIL